MPPSIPAHWTWDLFPLWLWMLRGVGPSSSWLNLLTLVMVPLTESPARLVQGQHFCTPFSSFKFHFQHHLFQEAFHDGRNNGTPKKTTSQSLEAVTMWSSTGEEALEERVSILRCDDSPWSSKGNRNNGRDKEEAGEREAWLEMSQLSRGWRNAEPQNQDIQVTSRMEKARAQNHP